jgi:teichuronic acid exporter
MAGKNTDSVVNKGMTHHTLSGLFWLFSSASARSVLRLIITAILARLLTPADFGMVAAAMVVVSFAEIFSLVGIGPSVVQFSSLEPRHVRTSFTISLLFGLLCGGVIALVAPGVAQFYKMTELVFVLRILAINFPLRGTAVVAESLLRRDLQFRKIAATEVVSYGLGYGVVGVLLALMGFGVWALVAATVAQTALRTVILLIMQPHPWSFQFEPAAAKELICLGGGFTSAKVFNYFALNGDSLVVGRWLGADALGFYTRSYNLMTTSVTLFGRVLDNVLFATMSRIQNEPKRLAIAYQRGVALVSLIVLPASTVSFILAPEIVDILLGPNWSEVIVPFQILAVGMLFRTGYKISNTLVRSVGAVYRNAWLQALYAFLVIGGAWVGQHWGLPGVALGVLFALAVHFVLMSQLGLHLMSMSWQDFLAAHVHAVRLAMIVGLEVLGVATILRNLEAPSVVVLVTPLFAVSVTLLILLCFASKFMLGREGMWLLVALIEHSSRFAFLDKFAKDIRNRLRSSMILR